MLLAAGTRSRFWPTVRRSATRPPQRPRTGHPPGGLRAVDAGSARGAGPVIRVLVVDDHAVVRAGLSSLLAATDDLECVGTAGDGVSALELVDRLAPDVLLLDLSLPGLDGVAVTQELRRSGRDARVLVLTSFCHSELVVDAVRAGADGFLFLL